MPPHTPSVRECLVRLDRMRDTPALAAELDAFAAEIFGDMATSAEAAQTEHGRAATRLRELHALAIALAASSRPASACRPRRPAAPRAAPKRLESPNVHAGA